MASQASGMGESQAEIPAPGLDGGAIERVNPGAGTPGARHRATVRR